MILDLDEQESWSEDFFQLIDGCDDLEEGLLDQIMAARHISLGANAETLLQRADEIFCRNYDYVVGYHACNVWDEGSYFENGIRSSNPDFLKQLAREIFAGFDALEDVLTKDEVICFERTSGTVGLLYSKKWAIESKVEYFQGSERLRTIACLLGSEAMALYSSLHKSPRILKCCISVELVENFTDHHINDYVIELVAFLLKRKIYPDLHIPPIDGGYLVDGDIPPHAIEFQRID